MPETIQDVIEDFRKLNLIMDIPQEEARAIESYIKLGYALGEKKGTEMVTNSVIEINKTLQA